MIAKIEYPSLWESPLIENSITTLLYIAMFILCIALASKRPEPGFKVLVVATGIWVLNIALVWTMSPVLLSFTLWLFPIGQVVMVVGLYMLVKSLAVRKST